MYSVIIYFRHNIRCLRDSVRNSLHRFLRLIEYRGKSFQTISQLDLKDLICFSPFTFVTPALKVKQFTSAKGKTIHQLNNNKLFILPNTFYFK